MARFILRPTFNDPFYEWYVRDSVIRGLRPGHRRRRRREPIHSRVPNSKSFNSITRRSEWLLLFFLATISAELPSLIGVCTDGKLSSYCLPHILNVFSHSEIHFDEIIRKSATAVAAVWKSWRSLRHYCVYSVLDISLKIKFNNSRTWTKYKVQIKKLHKSRDKNLRRAQVFLFGINY